MRTILNVNLWFAHMTFHDTIFDYLIHNFDYIHHYVIMYMIIILCTILLDYKNVYNKSHSGRDGIMI